MEQPATAPASSNAIRGAEQIGNIANNSLLGRVKMLEAIMAIWEA